MSGWDRDPAVRRFERDAIAALAGMAAIALVVRGGNPDAAVGVALGGLLVGASYGAIKSGVDLLLARRAARGGEADAPRPDAAGAGQAEPGPVVGVAGVAPGPSRIGAVLRAASVLARYALLALAAYVMLARFHAHPVGVIGGVTAPFLAAIAQLPRLWRQGSRLR